MKDREFLALAVELSKKSISNGGFPVGAIVVVNDEVVGKGLSDGKRQNDATCHAEMDAIRNASFQLGKRNLVNAVVYSSMEPCIMCFSACYWSKISRIVYAVSYSSISNVHREGENSIRAMNKNNFRKMEICHLKELETEATQAVLKWEKSQMKESI